MDAVALLATTDLFAGLPDTELQALADLAEDCWLASGEQLYREGDASAFFYMVAHGRLRVDRAGELLGYVQAGEPVGEFGIIAGEPRSSCVSALRNTHLLRFPGAAFIELLNCNAPLLFRLTRLMLSRTRSYESSRRRSALLGHGTLAILPSSPDQPVMVLAEELVTRLSGWPKARLISAAHVDATLGEGTAQADLGDADAGMRLARWLAELEQSHRYLVFVADSDRDNWAQRCLTQAERVLIVADAGSTATRIQALDRLRTPLLAPVELVLLRSEGDPSPHTLHWLETTTARAHYYVHPWSAADLDALARQVSGRGIGLVLGGGGARGFAHIGLLNALRQLKIPVDVMGGTSMGAFIGALFACGYDAIEIAQITRETFVSNNYLNDITLPRVSLIRGRRFLARLREIFGDRNIEELNRSYYCVSTSLTSGAAVIHDRGPLALWVGSSMSIPGVAPPVAFQGELLCDGGVVNNLPTDFMQRLERGAIVASSVSVEGDIRAPGLGELLPDPEALFNWKAETDRPGFSEILMRTATLTADTVIERESVERADVFLHMPVQEIGLFSWNRLDDLIERGYEHAMEQLEPLREQLVA